MYVAFFDEFGHIGPFVARNHPRFKTSPVFGMGGFVLPHEKVRDLSMWFYKLKTQLFATEIAESGKHPSIWEKKGSTVFTNGNMKNYEIRRAGMRLISTIRACGGNIVYYGREKYQTPEDSNPSGLYTTVLSHTIRNVDRFCSTTNTHFMMILDENDDRMKLFAAAVKTMYGKSATRHLVEPPMQVESHLYNSVQAADWICTLLGRLLAYKVCPDQYADYSWAPLYFGPRIEQAVTHSTLWRPRQAKTLELPLPAPAKEPEGHHSLA